MRRNRPLLVLALALSLGFPLILGSCKLQDGGDRIAYLYGVSLYVEGAEGYWPNLASADNDAVAMADLLGLKGYTTYLRASGEGTSTPELPTKAQMLADIRAVPAGTERLVMYYSGHGYQYTRSNGDIVDYLVMHGALPTANPNLMLDAAELLTALEESKARSVGLILDSCFSGGFALPGDNLDLLPPSVQKDSGSSVSIYAAPLSFKGFGTGQRTKVVVLSAAGADEESWEFVAGGGVFTAWLLETPLSSDYNSDGLVTMGEAWRHAKAMANQWNATYRSRYHFYPHLSGGSADLVLFDAD